MKKTLAVIFGGKSGEHEVSLVSASSIIRAVDSEKYNVLEVGITVEGRWFLGEGCLKKFKESSTDDLEEVFISVDPDKPGFFAGQKFYGVDICFPVLHGPFGEDGRIQGLFEMMNVPYVGCGVLASSTAMDKLQCKALWDAAGLPIVPYVGLNRGAWEKESDEILKDILKNIGLPCFVKPANMGSSVGITKVKEEVELRAAIDLAASFDKRILVEKSINAHEIECAVIGNEDAETAPLGEIIVGGEFYDFNDKYVNGVSTTEIPAQLDENLADKIKDMSLKAYKTLDCEGLARVDSFVDRDTGDIYLNELNTMPGFTDISMYPKMMGAKGLTYVELIERLIELGVEAFSDRARNQIVFDSGSDWYQA